MNMVYVTDYLKQLCMNQREEYYRKYTSCCITFVHPIYKIVIRIIRWTTSMKESSIVKSLYLIHGSCEFPYIQIICLEQRIFLKMH